VREALGYFSKAAYQFHGRLQTKSTKFQFDVMKRSFAFGFILWILLASHQICLDAVNNVTCFTEQMALLDVQENA
jgi:hypothetical protein